MRVLRVMQKSFAGDVSRSLGRADASCCIITECDPCKDARHLSLKGAIEPRGRLSKLELPGASGYR